jgi:GntR family transcriptional regulator, transcriptional repressor for pyruvate dehydrogenase complex
LKGHATTDLSAAFGADVPVDQNASGPPKLSDIAYARIAAGIANGNYAVGGKLPTENALAETLSVSRPIVREALSRLRDDGLVVSRRGSGTYVRRTLGASDRRLAPLSSIADMRRCLEYRLSLEGETAYHAALHLTDEGQQSLRGILDRLDIGVRGGGIDVEDDFNFHLTIANCTQNRFFSAGVSTMREPITVGMNITRNFAFLRTNERLEALHLEHVRIYEAIVARKPEAAREAMRTHLTNAMTRAFEGTLS